MALTFIADIQGWSADLNSAILVDETVYGGSNLARSSVALYLYFYKRSADLVDTQISVDNSQPLTVNQWTFTLPANDGVFVGILFAFPIWQAGTYNQNAAVYYQVNSNFYIANTTTSQTPGSGGQWTLVTDVLGQITGISPIDQGQFYAWSSARSQAGPLGDAMADFGNSIKQGRCKNWEGASSIITGAAVIESAFTNFRRGNYVNAQQDIDWVQQQSSLTI